MGAVTSVYDHHYQSVHQNEEFVEQKRLDDTVGLELYNSIRSLASQDGSVDKGVLKHLLLHGGDKPLTLSEYDAIIR